ncbi:hypothetical protein V5O48_009013 [Marasmius crinis-equi]|uniref:Uncharacterized protein n=1 Tax=Marasmius crinis-equi TaxID=585013 RepID=A0ABR3FCE3_9AGAR
MSHWPAAAFIRRILSVIPGIGKLHEPAHKQEDHQQYSLNLIRGAGNTDGEAQERIWVEHNKLGNATPCFGFWNWLKYCGMGSSLRSCYTKAVKNRNLQVEAHEGLTGNIPAALVHQWEEMCVKWEAAPWPKSEVFNPFEIVEEYQSQADCLWELALDNEQRLKNGRMEYSSVSSSSFVALSLDLRESQRRLKDQLKAQQRDPTSRQTRRIVEQQNTLRRTLASLDRLRLVYMPGLERYVKESKLPDVSPDVQPEDVPVYLPSNLPEVRRGRMCIPELADIEARLQYARCLDSLNGLRHTLRVKTRMILFKKTNVHGQRDSGRSREVINRVVFQVRAFAESYREARAAYKNLVGEGSWEKKLQLSYSHLAHLDTLAPQLLFHYLENTDLRNRDLYPTNNPAHQTSYLNPELVIALDPLSFHRHWIRVEHAVWWINSPSGDTHHHEYVYIWVLPELNEDTVHIYISGRLALTQYGVYDNDLLYKRVSSEEEFPLVNALEATLLDFPAFAIYHHDPSES